MSLLTLLGLWLVGWFLLRYFSIKGSERFFLAYPLGLLVTGICLQTLWFLGVPFFMLITGWWCLVGATLVLLWNAQDLPRISLDSVRQYLKVKIQLPSVSWSQWPLLWLSGIVLGGITLFSVWSWTVRPVGWDSLTLYETRARLITADVSLSDFKAQFANFPDARAYDFLHPFTSSLISALFLYTGSEFTSVSLWALWISVLAVGFKRLVSFPARGVFLTLVFGTRLIWEQLMQGYPASGSAAFWLLLMMEVAHLSAWKKHSFSQALWRGLLLSGAVGWRSSEPWWYITVGIFVTLFGLLHFRQPRSWGKAVILLLPSLLVRQSWNMVAQWARSLATSPAPPKDFPSLGDLPQFFLQFPLWPFILLFLLVLALHPRVRSVLRRFLPGLLLTFLCSAATLTAVPWLAYTSNISVQDLLSAWPRVALVPAIFLVWAISLVVDDFLRTPRLTQKKSAILGS